MDPKMVSSYSSINQPNPLNSTNSIASKNNNRPVKPSKDRHLKVDGRDRRTRLPFECAERVFELSKKLGHRNSGQTIEWLLAQAEPAVNAVLSTSKPSSGQTSSSSTPVSSCQPTTYASINFPTLYEPRAMTTIPKSETYSTSMTPQCYYEVKPTPNLPNNQGFNSMGGVIRSEPVPHMNYCFENFGHDVSPDEIAKFFFS